MGAMTARPCPVLSRLAALGLALIAACGSADPAPGVQTVQGVKHLAPQLVTPQGRVPAAPALFARRAVEREWAFTQADWPVEWAFENVAHGLAPLWGGHALLPERLKGPDMGLVLDGELDTRRFNVVEVRLVRRKDVHATVTWKRAGDAKVHRAIGKRTADGRATLVRFEVAQEPGWQGTIEALTVHPSAGWNQPVELLSIELVDEPFSYGDDRLEVAEADAGDGGLIERAGLAVRAWPVQVGGVLASDVAVPGDGLLSFELSRGPHANPVPLAVEVHASVPGASSAPATLTVHLPTDADAWQHATLDLAAFAGETARIEFRAQRADDGQASGLPVRADVLVGAPLVLGRLHADRRPNIVLVTSDTTRYDAFGPYQDVVAATGEVPVRTPRVHTPFLDAFAQEALVFDDAWSQSNSTQPSHASILTGLSVQDHSIFDNYGVLSAEAETLAERLRAVGYQTAAATCQASISNGAGFGQGFDLFLPPGPGALEDGRGAIEQAQAWISGWSAERDRPFFLWVHVFDPHTPYVLPEGQLEAYTAVKGPEPAPVVDPPTLPNVAELPPEMEFLQGVTNHAYAEYLYHAEVTYTDKLLAELFGSVRAAGLEEHTVEIITADHGESLGERSNFFNHRGLYPETLHVPLLVRVPGTPAARIPALVTNRDIKPTVLGLLGMPSSDGGRDLTTLVGASATAPERVWFEHANGHVVGCRDERYHFNLVLRDDHAFGLGPVPNSPYLEPVPRPKGSVELYDVKADPALTHNLADERPEVVAEYLAIVEAYRAAARPVGSEKRAMTAEEEAQMESLGYTGD